MIVTLLFLSFFALMILGIPIGVAIGLSSVITLAFGYQDVPMTILPQRMIVASNSFTLMAIPFFMLAGEVMDKSGITQRLVNFANAIVGWLKCGMTYISVVSGMFMGGISGSCTADTAALSSIMIPSMNKLGYKKSFSAALQAASGAIGVIIPPSIPMIILGGVTGISVGKLFMSGIFPGIFIGIGLMIAARLVCIKQGMGVSDLTPFSLKGLYRALLDAFFPMLAPIIIMGGILSGIFTPTESSVIAVIYTLFIGAFVFKTVKPDMLLEMFTNAAKNTAVVMLVVGCSTVFSWILSYVNFPTMLTNTMLSISHNSAVILLMINIMFFIGGMFIDGTPLIIMFVPVVMPTVIAAGINPILFGLMICVNTAIGALTPPVGAALFVASSVGNVKFEQTAKSIGPFVLVMVICLAIIGFFPQIATFLPETFMK